MAYRAELFCSSTGTPSSPVLNTILFDVSPSSFAASSRSASSSLSLYLLLLFFFKRPILLLTCLEIEFLINFFLLFELIQFLHHFLSLTPWRIIIPLDHGIRLRDLHLVTILVQVLILGLNW